MNRAAWHAGSFF
uniref:Uncharacterized protein n=1 Tax=Anguilla anguilla TaxID=7936 RepID=A0A0E9SQ09_ANGAN